MTRPLVLGEARPPLCVLSSALPQVGNSVGDYAWLLAQQLAEQWVVTALLPLQQPARSTASLSPDGGGPAPGRAQLVRIPTGWTLETSRAILRSVRLIRPAAVLVHYVPQLYGWMGAKPILAWTLGRLKQEGIPVITIAHEFHVPFGPSPQLAALSAVQRGVLRLLVRASARVIVTTPFVEQLLHQRFPDRAAHIRQIPVSNTLPVIPLSAERRTELRRQLDIDPAALVVATLGSDLPDTDRLLEITLAAIVRQKPSARVLALGRRSEALQERLRGNVEVYDRLVVAGPLDNRGLSEHIGLGDVYLALFPDGASTRRSSLMAGLAHELAVVSNDGRLTDDELRRSSALCLLDGEHPPSNSEPLRQITGDSAARQQLAHRGFRLYQSRFSWAEIAARYTAVLEELAA